ncbi:hypothetical protein [Streptomyces sp. Ac-502]|uniref:hypothetical protein n=1 Tax=Streptomyces sp. Ac-502 TaxID=3342801 RepID=UPI0038621E95
MEEPKEPVGGGMPDERVPDGPDAGGPDGRGRDGLDSRTGDGLDGPERNGTAPAGPQPLGVVVTPTGDAAVDAQLRRLADADHLAASGHLAVYEDVHRGLRDALAALDRRPGPAGPSGTGPSGTGPSVSGPSGTGPSVSGASGAPASPQPSATYDNRS